MENGRGQLTVRAQSLGKMKEGMLKRPELIHSLPLRTTLFLINADNSEAAMAIHNTIVETLVKNGVDLKK